jgi:hypothetical protein
VTQTKKFEKSGLVQVFSGPQIVFAIGRACRGRVNLPGHPGVDFMKPFWPKFTEKNSIWSNLTLLLWPYKALK